MKTNAPRPVLPSLAAVSASLWVDKWGKLWCRSHRSLCWPGLLAQVSTSSELPEATAGETNQNLSGRCMPVIIREEEGRGRRCGRPAQWLMCLHKELQEGRGEGITKSSPCQPLGQQRARVCWLLEGFLQQAQEGSKFVRSSKWHLRGENGGWDFPGSAKPLSRSLSLAWLVILFYLQRESILPFLAHPSKSSEFQYRSLSFWWAILTLFCQPLFCVY